MSLRMENKNSGWLGKFKRYMTLLNLAYCFSILKIGGKPMKLVYLDNVFKESFTTYYDEYLNDEIRHQQTYLDLYNLGKIDFQAYLEKLKMQSIGKMLPEGWAPSHTLFLVDNNIIEGVIRIRENLASEFLEKYIGHIGYDIRPLSRGKGYGKEILRLGLIKAKEIGLEEVLILCSEDNPASRRIIEGNGGIYESNIVDSDGELLRRYWINFFLRS